jgi:predicted nuclease of predicted toxin-antitoxin system
MKFLLDAHWPPALCAVLQTAGHDAVHTSQLTDQNRTPDEEINELSLKEPRAVVTKDTDFYHSRLLHGKPWKLLLIRTGNIRARDLTLLFERFLPTIVAVLDKNSLVELDWKSVRVIV